MLQSRWCVLVMLALASGCNLLPDAHAAAPTPEEKPSHALPYTPSLDLTAMDKTADPCADFYQYSCGGWMKQNPLPSDQAAWSVYAKLEDDNRRYLWGILEENAHATNRDAVQQKIGDYFASCMDLKAIEAAGKTPLDATLADINALTSIKQVAPVLARLHAGTRQVSMEGPVAPLFAFDSAQDFGNATRVIAFAFGSGLGLPDRDYYLKTDDKSVETRQHYVAHVARMLELSGQAAAQAAADAAAVMALETELAKASLTLVQKREPHNLYHRFTRKQLLALTPSFDWAAYLSARGVDITEINVTEPAFFKEVEHQLKTRDLATWKSYLRWHATRALAQNLSQAFVDEDFAFEQKYLRGLKEQKPRWKKCVAWVDRDLGEALGQEFVRRTFTADTRDRVVKMTELVEQAMEQEIQTLSWIGKATRVQASAKLRTIKNKIGYPSTWRDYSALNVTAGDFAGNRERASVFESRRQLGKIGKPLDRNEWGMTPPTVNAYYDPQMNDINFPAGVLQPPLFDLKLDDAPNYGNTGATIGHELTHAFDDQGRQFDGAGNLKDWWTKKDAAEFEKRASCVKDQYKQYVVVDDIHINSALTVGEDLADLGGTVLAWLAWKAATKGAELQPVDAMTPDQRYFVGMAQWACENDSPEHQRLQAATNPHSPGRYRINGVVANMPEFASAFACKEGAPLKRATPCKVW